MNTARWLAAVVRGSLLGVGVVGCSAPGATPPATLSAEQLMDPETCRGCHSRYYAEWSGSMHAYASRDPLFVALNQRAQDASNVGTWCATCHAPMAVKTRATKDGTNLATLPARLQGVTCYACHNVTEITNTHNNSVRLGNDSTLHGAFDDALPSAAHDSAYSALHDQAQPESATLCGTCHDVVNGHGVAIERSFAEWQASAFAGNAGSTCGQCHMPIGAERGPIADAAAGPARERHAHRFPGVDLALSDFPEQAEQRQAVQSLLDTTLRTALCVRGSEESASLVVLVQNLAGHDWPSGAAQDRRAWFEVAAYTAHTETYRSGAVAPGKDPDPATDPELWLVSDCLLDQDGNAVSKLWDALQVDSNLLPAQSTFERSAPEFFQSVVARSFPKDPSASLKHAPTRATLDVHLLPFPFTLFDDLFSDPTRLGMDADRVARLRQELGALRVGQQLVWTAAAATDTAHGAFSYLDRGVPMSCVSSTGLDSSTGQLAVAAPEHRATACLTP